MHDAEPFPNLLSDFIAKSPERLLVCSSRLFDIEFGHTQWVRFNKSTKVIPWAISPVLVAEVLKVERGMYFNAIARYS
jgi:hypothetical protein